jgi:biopolymer transport protein ExbD
MAIQMAGGGTGGRRRRGMPSMSEINVTPFVDVVLVLLIIFIITAHVMDYGIEIQVPKTKAVATSVKDLPVVLISAKGEIYLGSQPVNKLGDLAAMIRSKYPAQNAVYVRADAKATWDVVDTVATELGLGKFALNFVSQPADAGSRR